MKLSDLKPGEYQFAGTDKDKIGGPLKLSDLKDGDYHFADEQENPSKSSVTAATTNAIQSAVPFAGAIGGAGKAALDAITGTRGPLAGGDLNDVLEDYRDARDQFSNDLKSSSQANPKTALVASLAGGAANPAFAAAKGLPSVIGASALQGLGSSGADLTKGEIGNASKDALKGAAAGALGYGAGKALNAAGSGIDSGLRNLGTDPAEIAQKISGKISGPAGLAGGILGSKYGHTAAAIGGGLGAGLGKIAESNAPPALSQIVNGYLKAGNSEALGKFAPLLQSAAQRGPNSLAVTLSMLSNNPEFKKQLGQGE